MNDKELLRNLILCEYKTIADFSKAANVSEEIIAAILENGIRSATVDVAIAVCGCLGIDIEHLANGDLALRPHLLKESAYRAYIEAKNSGRASVNVADIENGANALCTNSSLSARFSRVSVEQAQRAKNFILRTTSCRGENR